MCDDSKTNRRQTNDELSTTGVDASAGFDGRFGELYYQGMSIKALPGCVHLGLTARQTADPIWITGFVFVLFQLFTFSPPQLNPSLLRFGSLRSPSPLYITRAVKSCKSPSYIRWPALVLTTKANVANGLLPIVFDVLDVLQLVHFINT